MHWKNLCWSWSSNTLATWCEELIDWKRPWCRERLRAGREGSSRKIVGWHHDHLNEHEFEQTPGDGEGQGSLACCSLWGLQRVRHDWATEQQQQWSLYDRLYNSSNLKTVWLENSIIFYLKFINKDKNILFRILAQMLKSIMLWAFLVAQMVKNLPAMKETSVQFLGWEDPL